MGPFWPAEHGPSSFTSHCCIPFPIPHQGGRDDSLDLKVEDAPCPLWICSEIFGIKLHWHCFHSGISLVMSIPHLMPSLLSLAYLLYWHFLFKDRPAVIRSPFLHWWPFLINLCAYYPLFNSFKLQNLAFSPHTLLVALCWTFCSLPCKPYSSTDWHVFKTICHPSTLHVDIPILGRWDSYLAALDCVPAGLLQKTVIGKE